MAAFLQTYQLPLILVCFVLGCLAALTLFKRTEDTRAWQIADVIWVALGGVGAVVAIAAGIYQEDSTALNRQITVAYTASRAFDTDAARFRLRYCAQTNNEHLTTLCEKVEFLSASSAENTALPLFLTITKRAAPLAGFSLLFGSPRDQAQMSQAAAELEMAEFLAFDTRDVPTIMAVEALAPTRPNIAADYRVLALTYDTLIADITALRDAWQRLQSGRALLILQIIALCLVAFAAPFRLGRTIDSLL
ncbi:hypothetical protein [Shimia sagamensis]|uniref:DUF4239 domain-containing protein n=1 Tax=Shimia sagamensis TaxID=1566352 RepID=A0ABY1NLR3_9RHOB|nr:hypothetical protein [Shimia sagamensis]SMP12990.1 hypothetical protein SAMN06265373_102426 [Shimia sagamensis]